MGSDDTVQGFIPLFLNQDSDLYLSLYGRTDMPSWGFNLDLSAFQAIGNGVGQGLIYTCLFDTSDAADELPFVDS